MDPFHAALLFDELDEVRRHPTRVNAQIFDERTPLVFACESGTDRGPLIDLLLEMGADPKLGDGSGETPLHAAARRGQAQLVTLLLSKGADTEAQNAKGETPLIAALCDPQFNRSASVPDAREPVELLLEAGANPNCTKDGHSALGMAIFRKRVDATALLLARGADARRMNPYGLTPVHAAVNCDCPPAFLPMILEGGGDPNAGEKETPLMAVIKELPYVWKKPEERAKRLEWVRLLLEHGANPNIGNARECRLACVLQQFDRTLVHMLLDGGMRETESQCKCRHDNLAHFIFELYSDHRMRDVTRNTAESLELVKRLMSAGYRMEVRHVDRSALAMAAEFGDPALIQHLLDAGAKLLPPYPYDPGSWPITVAAKYGRPDAVRLLLKAGSPWRIPGRCDGEFVTMGNKSTEVERALVKAGSPSMVQAFLLQALRGVYVMQPNQLPYHIKGEDSRVYACRIHGVMTLYRLAYRSPSLPPEMLLPVLAVATRIPERFCRDVVEWDARWPIF